ncbi:MAG TPA: hypothetical protein VIR31_03675 [Nitrososphaeraceae archaeon]
MKFDNKITEFDMLDIFDNLITKTIDHQGMETVAHLLMQYYYANKGPQNFETWRDAAIYERVRRVKAEELNKRLSKSIDELQEKLDKINTSDKENDSN